jgi:PKD repeat protein
MPKIPDFSYSPLFPDVGENVNFVFKDTLKTGESLSWQFDSGNPLNSSDVNPTIFFTDSGYKNIRLEASNTRMCCLLYKTNLCSQC